MKTDRRHVTSRGMTSRPVAEAAQRRVSVSASLSRVSSLPDVDRSNLTTTAPLSISLFVYFIPVFVQLTATV